MRSGNPEIWIHMELYKLHGRLIITMPNSPTHMLRSMRTNSHANKLINTSPGATPTCNYRQRYNTNTKVQISKHSTSLS